MDTATVNEEMTGTLDEVEALLIFAAESLDASDDATAVATAPAALEYLAAIEAKIAVIRAAVAERLAAAE